MAAVSKAHSGVLSSAGTLDLDQLVDYVAEVRKMDIVPVDEVYEVVRRGNSPSPSVLPLPALWIRLSDLTCPHTQANIVQCLQEEQLESITFAQFRDWAHGPEGEQKDEGCVLS